MMIAQSRTGIRNVYTVRENGYRFTFNGMEKDDEVKGVGNSLDFGARIYDSRLGRWLSVDPLSYKFPFASPYTFVDNNPIYYIDPDGRVKVDAKGNVIFKAQGKPILVNHPSGSSAQVQMGVIYADDGTEIQAFKNITGDKGWDTDCHGVTFAEGQVWINNDQVDKLLIGDNYESINKSEASKNDIVVYRNKNNEPEHSVTVVSSENETIIVNGQGGLEKENHQDEVNSAWDKNSTQDFYRKRNRNEKETKSLPKIDKTIPKMERDNTDVGKGGNAADGF